MYAGLLYSLPLAAVAGASAFGWMVAYLRGPDIVAGYITAFAGTSGPMIMFLLVCVFVIVGDFIDAVPAIIIFMPIINKLTEVGSIHPLHMGVVIITTLVFGLITPPYGLSLLVASKYVGVGFGKSVVRSLPLYVVFLLTIAFTVLFRRSYCGCPSSFSRNQSAASRRPAERAISARETSSRRGRMNSTCRPASAVCRASADAKARREHSTASTWRKASTTRRLSRDLPGVPAVIRCCCSRRESCLPRRRSPSRGSSARCRCTSCRCTSRRDFPRLYRLSNLDEHGKPNGKHPDKGTLAWHTDGSWRRVTGQATIIYGEVVLRNRRRDALLRHVRRVRAAEPRHGKNA